jgi:RNA polymerase sigma-70 factor (ECF subfamily)
MAGVYLRTVLDYVRQVGGPSGADRLTDRGLLRRFVEDREEAAFALLVQRHGPMVLGVCRRVLADRHDAEDAFQATFLVLARRAASIRKQESVGSWLYGVAYRTAVKARARAARRRDHERRAAAMTQTDPVAAATWRELRPVLDAELNRLPEKYRAPLVLCYLEGKTNAEAARLLGWTKGTVSGRLARARDLLRGRLTRRGLTLAPALLVGVLSERAASAAVPTPLALSTVKAAGLCAVGQSFAAVGASAEAAALAEGVFHAMFLSKVKVVLVLLAALVGLGTGGGLLCYVTRAADGPSAEKKAQSAAKAEARTKSDRDRLQGTWRAVSLRHSGSDEPKADIGKASLRLTFAADKVTVHLAGQSKEGTYQLNPGRTPREIDIIIQGEKGSGDGIYKIEGDTLTLCLQDANKGGRPKGFAADEGSHATLIVLRRVKKGEKVADDPASLKEQNEQLRRQLEKAQRELERARKQLRELQALAEDARRAEAAARAEAEQAAREAQRQRDLAERQRRLAEEQARKAEAEARKAL